MAEKLDVETEEKLADYIGAFYDDPYGFVMGAFPWGEKGSPLEHKHGPEPWQTRLLKRLGEHIKRNAFLRSLGIDVLPWRSVRVSGHGVGKSALVAWLILFFMSTRVDLRGVVTASTANQLSTKTWPELSKWHSLAINSHWFLWEGTMFSFAQYPENKKKNYMVQAATVSDTNTEAFAGLHNEGKAILIIFDEASGVADKVFEVAEGATTDGEPFTFMFGNPTRPEGFFHDCAINFTHMYDVEFVDSREVSHTNKTAIQGIIDRYGIDSDTVKVRVRGMFPDQAFDGYMTPSTVNDAMSRDEWTQTEGEAALVLGVDVARFGDDKTVLFPRRGRDGKTLPLIEYEKLSTRETAIRIADWARVHNPDAIIIENVGPGAGVIDNLRAWGWPVIEVHPGAKAALSHVYANERMEWWAAGKKWLEVSRGCLQESQELYGQLTKIRYKFSTKTNTMQMETKDEMKKRGLKSPDHADAFILTFARHVVKRSGSLADPAGSRTRAITEYDELAHGISST